MKSKNTFKLSLVHAMLISVLMISVYSCSDDDTTVTQNPTGPEANSISGTITFTDTNFVTSGGYYDISVFNSWFPMGSPTGNDSLVITKVGNTYQANYKVTNIPNGTYYLTSAWIKLPYVPGTSVNGLGLYGCDTTLCMSPTAVTITDNVGRENINFLSKADTAKRIYQF